jgi:FAD/FMN-containing dehydrogenase/Fe-S oxidoreductase
MTHSPAQPVRFSRGAEHSAFARRLAREVDGQVLFDAASLGRYATDASIYQVTPVGVVVPRTADAAICAMQLAVEEGVAVLPRGAGTSQCGQAVGHALVIDDSKHLGRVLEFDPATKRAVVQPGVVLDALNAQLRAHGLWYPVDVSTSAQATLGGMSGNNSCGSRSLAYGNMVDRVLAIDAWLPTGVRGRFDDSPTDARIIEIADRAAALFAREKDEIAARFPKVARNVAGYNLGHLAPRASRLVPNLASLLVGSEGTLAWFEKIHLQLADLPKHRVLGVAHFPRFHDAMDATQHIVKLGPCAVELVDRTMLELALSNPAFAPIVRKFVKGAPDAILLVEFSGAEAGPQLEGVKRLGELMGDLGFGDAVVEIADAAQQKSLWDVRKAGLNIMMSMKGDGKPVSFIEDCAVPLEHLAEYTAQLTEVFRKHGTEGTWYAHASVGCLHVRPILNMKGDGAVRMRAIAGEAAELVRRFKGSYSGEHGDGLVRSEWIAPFFGPRLTASLAEIKSWFDPRGLMNPGKIVDPPRQDDRTLFRYPPGYATQSPAALDWSEWGGLAGAVEMCNNNGHCRKFDAGTMCPSYRATGDERDLTRGRANTLRLALSGQIEGEDFAGESAREALELCVSCKGCRRECPTGVDMARMKIEFTAAHRRRNGFTPRDRVVGHLPRYASWMAAMQPFASIAQKIPGAGALVQSITGFDRRRPLPVWKQPWSAAFRERSGEGRPVVLFADTFNNWFEPDNLSAAVKVLEAGGHRVIRAGAGLARPLCCGRTYLTAGMIDEARAEAGRTLDALAPHLDAGTPIVGLEPSCIYTFRDEFLALFPGDPKARALAQAVLIDEYLADEFAAGRTLPGLKHGERSIRVHGHCHQKAFGTFDATLRLLRSIPGAQVEAIESSCCGMAGSFGHEHYDVSMKMAEAALLPAVRAATGATIVAAGTSCRQQIAHGAGRDARHPICIVAEAL